MTVIFYEVYNLQLFTLCVEPEDKITLPELLKGGSFTRGKRRFSFKTIQNIQAAKAYVDLALAVCHSVISLVRCLYNKVMKLHRFVYTSKIIKFVSLVQL